MNLRLLRSLVVASAIAFSAHLAGTGQSPLSSAALCTTAAVAATADAFAATFAAHQFVFVGSTHGDAKIDEFLTCLVSRPTFKQRVTDIVAEWASSGHQRLLDQYLFELAPVSRDSLAPVWFDTDAPTLWTTLPQVRRFLEALREVNRNLPATRRIRLLGGNEGIEWAKVRSPEDLAPYPFKTNFMVHLIPEHLARTPGNRTLVVYGDGHIRHDGRGFVSELESTIDRSQLFVVGTIRDLHGGERDRVARFGDPARPFFVEAPHFPAGAPSPSALRTSAEERPDRLADYVDAVLYLGPEPDRDLRGSLPLSTAQQNELARRGAILSDPQRVMRVRYSGRAQWFRAHPNDLPPRPQGR